MGYFNEISPESWSLDNLSEWCYLLMFHATKRKFWIKSIQDMRDNPVSDYAKLKADYMFTNLEVSISLHLVLNYWHNSGLLVVWVLNCWFTVV